MDIVVVYVFIQNGSQSLGLEALEPRYVLGAALYRRSLFYIDNVDLPSSQCVCFAFGVRWFLLVFMCCPGISLRFLG
jgi:hypothetical protein